MRALTLWRPWPWAIFHAPRNPKRVENRSWKPWPSIIGKAIVLHAGQTFDKESVEEILCRVLRPDEPFRLPANGADEGLIGVATVRGYAEGPEGCEQFMFRQSEWFTGQYAWLLSDVRAFPEPIPCKGAQGLWELPGWAVARVREALR